MYSLKVLHAGIMSLDANEASRHDNAIIMIIIIMFIFSRIITRMSEFCDSASAEFRAKLASVDRIGRRALCCCYRDHNFIL